MSLFSLVPFSLTLEKGSTIRHSRTSISRSIHQSTGDATCGLRFSCSRFVRKRLNVCC